MHYRDLAAAEVGREEPKADSQPRDDRDCDATFMPFFPSSEPICEPERLYTAEDLAEAVAQAEKAASSETEARLIAAMADDQENRRNDLMSAIGEKLDRHRSAFDGERDRLADVCSKLALAISQAVIPRALERQPLVDISDLLKDALARLVGEPSIELRVAPARVETAEELFRDLVESAGFPGEFAVIADAAMGEGDVLLRWNGGAVERRVDRLQAEAGRLVGYLLPDEPGDQDPIDSLPSAAPAEPTTVPGPQSESKTETPNMSEPSHEF